MGIGTDAVDEILSRSFGEIRPFEFNAGVARAVALADQTPDPELSALIAITAVCRSTLLVRHANLRGLAHDGSFLVATWGGTYAIPPELRRFLATWHQQLTPIANRSRLPVFPWSHALRSQHSIRRSLDALDAPAWLWEDPEGTADDGLNADGRAFLHQLTPGNVWPAQNDQVNAD